MTSTGGNPGPTVTTQKAWAQLMRTLGGTNLSRASQARKAANMLNAYWSRH
jgi:hypothetical protein